MCSWFAGIFRQEFAGYYICLDPTLVVDSSFVFILLTCSCSCLHRPVPRGKILRFECAVYISDSALDIQVPPSDLRFFLNIVSVSLQIQRNSGKDYKAEAVGC